MIEINLLPEDIRTTEGTPPKRFALYIGFLMLILLMGFYIVQIKTVAIPNMVTRINRTKVEIEQLKKMRDEIDKISAEIDVLNKKIQDLDELNLNRVRFARLFDRLSNAVPEGVWFKTFTFAADASVSQRYATPGGRRYSITMSGNAVGQTPQERDNKFSELIGNIEKQFNIPPPTAPVPVPTPEDFGFCKFIGARFESPKPASISVVNLPEIIGIDPKAKAQLSAPKVAQDFTISIAFDMLAPKQAQ